MFDSAVSQLVDSIDLQASCDRAASATASHLQPGSGGTSSHVSPATCASPRAFAHRRPWRHRAPHRHPLTNRASCHGLTALVEVTLDRAVGAEHCHELRGHVRWRKPQVQPVLPRVARPPISCWCVQVARHARLSTRWCSACSPQDANVRNVKSLLQRASREVRHRASTPAPTGRGDRGSMPSHRRPIESPRRSAYCFKHDQPLQVFALWKIDRRRMVAGAAPRRCIDQRRRRCASMPAPATILWNSSGPMPPEHENVSSSAPPGREQLERQAIDVLVGTRGAVGVSRRRREFGRVQHDRVEADRRAARHRRSVLR